MALCLTCSRVQDNYSMTSRADEGGAGSRINICYRMFSIKEDMSFSNLLSKTLLSSRRMCCLIRRGLSGAGSSAEGLRLGDSAGLLHSEGFLEDATGLLLRAPLSSSRRGEPGMVFLALAGVDLLMSGAVGVSSEEGRSRGGSEDWAVLVLHSTSAGSLMAGEKKTE